ncbi:cation diffusion facilitator family transporter [Corallincola luteus]
MKNAKGERRTLYVLILTAITMVAEIIAGTISGSMALLADGWHMATHVAAFMITLFAYHYARKHANDPAFSFGTGKVNVLGGFASAIALAVVALLMLVESTHRLIEPQSISFDDAIAVAVIGLLINIIGAFLLKDEHSHHHDHHHDHNLHAAYMHVLADALTSLLAIFALLAGKFAGLDWLDPVMGIVGSVIVTRWAISLLKQTSPILLDRNIEPRFRQKIVASIESDADNRVSDIHIWKIGANHYSAIIAVVTHEPKPIEHYRALLAPFRQLSHLTIEVNQCQEH